MLTLLFAFACGGDKTHDSGDHDHDTGMEDTSSEDTGSGDTGSEDTGDDEIVIPETYNFENDEGESTVSYSGQVARHLLISDLKSTMGSLQASIDDASFTLVDKQDIVDYLSYTIDCPNDTCDELDVSGMSDVHATLGEISGGKNLIGKLAGNDSATDHKVWTDGTSFKGWPGVDSPEALLRTWIEMTAEQSVMAINGDDMQGGSATVSAAGHDLTQLVQKFLLGAVAFSQGADDYLDSDVEGKGLLASNIPAEGKTYSGLGHAWDEGFGYFGAARDYTAYTDMEIKSGDKIDTNGDGAIDPKSEGNKGHSVNAAKRDVGSEALAPTDYTQQAWDGFIKGRALINSKLGSELSADDIETLKGYRDSAIDAWERAIAATVLHYINDCIQDINGYDGSDWSGYAKHWGELKGFALGLQFNPRSHMSDSDFVAFHDLIGTAPVLPGDAGIEAYKTDLINARELLANSYSFDAALIGDADGNNGW